VNGETVSVHNGCRIYTCSVSLFDSGCVLVSTFLGSFTTVVFAHGYGVDDPLPTSRTPPGCSPRTTPAPPPPDVPLRMLCSSRTAAAPSVARTSWAVPSPSALLDHNHHSHHHLTRCVVPFKDFKSTDFLRTSLKNIVYTMLLFLLLLFLLLFFVFNAFSSATLSSCIKFRTQLLFYSCSSFIVEANHFIHYLITCLHHSI